MTKDSSKALDPNLTSLADIWSSSEALLKISINFKFI